MPEATTTKAANILVISRRTGLISLISSHRPTIRVRNAAQIIPVRCLSKGNKIREVAATAKKTGNPPPRGTAVRAVAFLVFWCFLMVMMCGLGLLLFVGLSYRCIIRSLGGVRDLMFSGFKCGFLRFFSLGSRFFRIVRLVSFGSFFLFFLL